MAKILEMAKLPIIQYPLTDSVKFLIGLTAVMTVVTLITQIGSFGYFGQVIGFFSMTI